MTNDEIKLYESASEFLMVANSHYREDLQGIDESLILKAKSIVDKYEADYLSSKISDNPDLATYLNSIEEAKNVLPILDESDATEIEELNDLIKKATIEIQSKVLFDPKVFYDKYFFNAESNHKDLLRENPLENERFKLWFANSKVVNDKKEPLIVYHGTGGLSYEFNEFKFSPFPAVYFAENKSYSDWFAEQKGGGAGIIFNCYLRVTNPMDLTVFELNKINYEDLTTYIQLTYDFEMPQSKMLTALSKKTGGMKAWQWLRFGTGLIDGLKKFKLFDGIHYYEDNKDQLINGKPNVTPAWLVFYGNQIKSADLRNTTFSLESNKTTMKKGGKL